MARFEKPDRSPPDDDGFEPPDRGGAPPDDSGEEGGRVDDVTPSPDPGLGGGGPPEDDNDGDQFDRPDRRGPTEREEQRTVAREVGGITTGDIQNVDDDGVTLSDSAREDLAREQFETRREQARRTADADAISQLGGYDTSELEFEATDDGVSVSPEAGASSNAAGRDSGTFEPSGTAAVVDSFDAAEQVGGRVEESEDAGVAAQAIDDATDAFEQQNPAAAGTISTLATSFRTDSGVPTGFGATLPGGEDVDEFTGSLEGSATAFDSAVASGVDRATLAADNAPLGLSEVPLRDPSTTAVAATIGTEAGRRGASAGIERGVQAFNPAAAAQDAARATEYGIRGADRVLDADEQQIQTGLDVGEAAGETAVEIGPEVAGAAAIDEPSRVFEVGATASTVGAAGALGPSAAAGGARAARRTAGDVFDSGSARRFLDDERGQFDGLGRSRGDDDDSVTIDADDIDPDDGFDPQRVTRAEVSRAPETAVGRTRGSSRGFLTETEPRYTADHPRRGVDTGDRVPLEDEPMAADRTFEGFDTGGSGPRRVDTGDRVPLEDEPMVQDRVFEGLNTGRSSPDFTGLTGATRRAGVDVSVPRDPLDTRGGLGFGTGATAESIATGAGVGGLLGQAAETAQASDLDFGPTLGSGEMTGLGIEVGTGIEARGDTDVTPTADTGTQGRVAQDEDQTPLEMLRLDARTQLGSRAAQRQDLRAVGDTDTITRPDQGTTGRSPTARPTGRPRRLPDLPDPDPEDEDDTLFIDEDADDATFGSGIASGEQAAEDIFGDTDSAFRL